MGIKATVVYDIHRHTTVALQTASVSIAGRYEVVDTIASFATHCESLRGVAHSVTEVSALWGGPPYITYDVVYDRFRAIVIWDEQPGEFDLSHDVENCLLHLSRAVASVQEPLARNSSKARVKIYEEAGYALLGDVPIILPDSSETVKSPPTKSKFLQVKPPSGLRRLSSADPKKRKSSAGASGFLGKIGNALKNATGTSVSDPKTGITHTRRPKAPSQDLTSSPVEISSQKPFAVYGAENGFDDGLGELDLPRDVFAWPSLSDEKPNRNVDLMWLMDLMHGQTEARTTVQKPALRKSSVSSTPLTLPSSGIPVSQGAASAASSILGDGDITQLKDVPNRQPSKVSTGGTTFDQSSRSKASVTPSPGKSAAKLQEHNENSHASNQRVIKNDQAESGILEASHGESQQLPTTLVSGKLPILQGRSHHPSTMQPVSDSPSIHVTAGAENVRSPIVQLRKPPAFTLPLATGQLSSAPPSAPRSDVSPALSSASKSHTGSRPNLIPIPPALAAEYAHTRDFDVSRLGDVKDTSASPKWRSTIDTEKAAVSNAVDGRANSDLDETLRSRMNEFAMTMQAGNFTLALQQVFATLKLLRQIQPRKERETITCSNYVIAQKILIRNSVLETELVRFGSGTPESIRRQIEMALLTMFLAELKHLLPRHRVAAMRVAIEKNIVVGNFGMCARWIRHLIEKAPPGQREELARRLEICEKRGNNNAQMPPTNRLCYITLQVLTSPYGACSVCSAVYHPQMAGVVAGQVCPTCFVGAVLERL